MAPRPPASKPALKQAPAQPTARPQSPRTPGLLCRICGECPIGKLLLTRSFWAASVVAFIVVFTTDWLLHTRYLMSDYAASSAFWRTENEIRHSLIFVTQAVTGMAYAAIILALGQTHRFLGSLVSGALAAVPVAMCAMSAYIMLPFATPYIPTVWAVSAILQGGLAGLAISAALRLSRAPEAAPENVTLH